MPRLDQNRFFLGPALTVLSANVEGYSTAKQQILAELCSNLPPRPTEGATTTAHPLRCPLLEHDCKAEDLAEYNECARNSVQLWLKHNKVCVWTR